ATQAVGALLILGLLAAPAGTAQRLTARPFRALWLSAALAVTAMWAGLAIAYAVSSIPPSFSILAVATALYLLAVVVTSVSHRRSPTFSARRGWRAAPGAGQPDHPKVAAS
ncbi:MAG: metal ABC transporter permease, partial [Acidimicrobiales bacterium]